MSDAAARTATRILLVDDHVVMRAGTRRILDDEPDIEVVGEAGDGAEALELTERLAPDVILLDIAMPGMDGAMACRALRQQHPEVRILVLTAHDNAAIVRALHRLGVSGYLLKSAGPDELLAAIRTVAAGRPSFSGEVLRVLRSEQTPGVARPTRKELAVLRAIAEGQRNREIAEALVMSVNTVEFHIRNIYSKLGATSRADALMRAQRLGWLDSAQPLC